jgi:branched-chain amino acid transport system permease protein
MSVFALVDPVLQGLLLGGLYALFAIGLSLSFGIMRMVNIAHGDIIILGAYATLVVVNQLGIHPLAAMVVVVPVLAGFGYLLQRILLNPVLGEDILPPLLVTFGLSVIIQNVLMAVFSADSKGVHADAIQTASISLGGGLAVGWLSLVIFVVAVAVVAGLELLFARTGLGRAFRATSDDQAVAQLMGINNRHLYAVATALAFGVTAIAGVFLAVRTTFIPTLGPSKLLVAFEVVIIGGMGSLWGTLAGAMLLGVAQVIGFRYDSGSGVLAGHLVFLVVLLLRPQGLIARTRDL